MCDPSVTALEFFNTQFNADFIENISMCNTARAESGMKTVELSTKLLKDK